MNSNDIIAFEAYFKNIKYKRKAIEADSTVQIVLELGINNALPIIASLTRLFGTGAYLGVALQEICSSDNYVPVGEKAKDTLEESIEDMSAELPREVEATFNEEETPANYKCTEEQEEELRKEMRAIVGLRDLTEEEKLEESTTATAMAIKKDRAEKYEGSELTKGVTEQEIKEHIGRERTNEEKERDEIPTTTVSIKSDRQKVLARIHILLEKIGSFSGKDEKKIFKENNDIESFSDVSTPELEKIENYLNLRLKEVENEYLNKDSFKGII